jgi:hypothetical protein
MTDTELNDELLCSYLDGELDEAARARVAAALEIDAGGRVRLERMRTADQRLRREIPPQERSGDPLADYILKNERGESAPRVSRRMNWYAGGALAAGLAGVVLGFVIARAPVGESTLLVNDYAAGPLSQVLEASVSGERVQRDGASVRVLLTLSGKNGRVCRLFETGSEREFAEGLACRERGRWRVISWDATVADDAGYRTAGTSTILDHAMDRLDAVTLDPAAERAALARGWEP